MKDVPETVLVPALSSVGVSQGVRRAWRCRQFGPNVMGVGIVCVRSAVVASLINWVLYSSFASGCDGPAGRFAFSSGCPRDWQGELCARASQSLTVREGLKCFVRREPRIDSSEWFLYLGSILHYPTLTSCLVLSFRVVLCVLFLIRVF